MRLPVSLIVSILALAAGTSDARPMGASKGRSLMPLEDVADIARLAAGLDVVACPSHRRRSSTAKAYKRLQPTSLQSSNRRALDAQENVVKKSWVGKPISGDEVIGLNWMIARDAISQSITLSISSLPLIDDTLDMLFEDYPAEELAVQAFPTLQAERGVKVHPAIMLYFEQEGRQAISAVSKLVAPKASVTTFLPRRLQRILGVPAPIRSVHIAGHGMGAAVAQLVAMALVDLDVDLDVAAFASPRVGNAGFAEWVNDSPIGLRRINSFADPMPHLPESFNGYAHAGSEIWIGPNPKMVFSCESSFKRKACFEEIPLNQTSLADHNGPFAGVWIGRGCPA